MRLSRIIYHRDQKGFSHKPKQFGFSLIELLVVIAIIGFLVTIVMVALNRARLNSRNAKRKQDAAQLRKGLELYYNAVGNYPLANGGACSATPVDMATLSTFLVPSYMASVPTDPKTPPDYQYACNNSGREYAITVPFSNDGATNEGGTCKFTTPGGVGLFPLVPTICSYQK